MRRERRREHERREKGIEERSGEGRRGGSGDTDECQVAIFCNKL